MNLSNPLRVFIDCEFTDFVKIDLISIGLAASNGETFYGENLDFFKNLSSEFVKNNIYPLLNPLKYGYKRTELSARIWDWIDSLPSNNIVIMIDYHSDWQLLADLLESKHPKITRVDNIFQNFVTWTVNNTYRIGLNGHDYQQLYQRLIKIFSDGVKEYFDESKENLHHALSDAKANRQGYQRVQCEFGV